MPIVTSPPININNATDRGEAPFSGPFEIGAALYLVTIESTPVQGIHVWKSTDGALTWTLKDSANQPSATGGVYNVVLIGAVFFIAFAQGSPSAVLEMITFDTGTDTYGVAVNSTFGLQGRIPEVFLSDNTIYLLYQKADTSIKYTTFAGGVFGAEVAFAAAASQGVISAVVDTLGVIHVFWSKFAAGTNTLNHTTITAGVVSAPQAVHANTSNSFTQAGKSDAVIFGTKIVYPSRTDDGVAAGVWVGTPIAAPVWTFELVDDIDWTGAGFPNESDAETFLFVHVGILYAFWVALDFSDGPIIDRSYFKSNDGSGWSAPTIYYDAVTDPQVFDPVADADQFIHFTNFTKLTGGSFGSFVALETPTFCAPFYLLPNACDITITVTPHGSAPVTVPDDGMVFALPPAYGLTPYTFSGPSTTPNAPALMQAVEGGGPPQNFEHSIPQGNLPQGMSLGGSIQGPDSSPVQSASGLNFQGTPTDNPTSPQTFIVKGRARLVQ